MKDLKLTWRSIHSVSTAQQAKSHINARFTLDLYYRKKILMKMYLAYTN
jgi:hypothetical protein